MSEYKLTNPALLLGLSSVMNTHYIDNKTNTPDYILAAYLGDCLDAYYAMSRAIQEEHQAVDANIPIAEYEPTNL